MSYFHTQAKIELTKSLVSGSMTKVPAVQNLSSSALKILASWYKSTFDSDDFVVASEGILRLSPSRYLSRLPVLLL